MEAFWRARWQPCPGVPVQSVANVTPNCEELATVGVNPDEVRVKDTVPLPGRGEYDCGEGEGRTLSNVTPTTLPALACESPKSRFTNPSVTTAWVIVALAGMLNPQLVRLR